MCTVALLDSHAHTLTCTSADSTAGLPSILACTSTDDYSVVSKHCSYRSYSMAPDILQVPEALDMGFAPVQGTVTQALKATNAGEAAVHCTWETGQPFSMVPDSASIQANQSFTFMCHFQPPEASVYTVLAACRANTGYTATVKVGMMPLEHLYRHAGVFWHSLPKGSAFWPLLSRPLPSSLTIRVNLCWWLMSVSGVHVTCSSSSSLRCVL